MKDDQIAKLYILDDKGGELGRLIIDVEALIQMYAARWTASYASQYDTGVMFEQSECPSSPDDDIVESVSENLKWYRKKDGTVYMKFTP